MAHLPDFDVERTRLFIPHYELALDGLPAQGSSWSDIVMLAESFDGSVVYPEHLRPWSGSLVTPVRRSSSTGSFHRA